MAATRTWKALGGAAAIAALGCGSDPAPAGGDGTGQLRAALTSSAGGATYVLANATFLVTRTQPPPTPGEITGVRLHASDPTAGDLTATLGVGRYTVTLVDGWQLERQDSPTSLVPVQATLLSANPVTVSISSGQTAMVTFQFQTTGIPITFGPGMIDIGIATSTCDPAPPPGVELNVVANPDFESGTDGWTRSAPFVDAVPLSNTAHCGLHSGILVPGDDAIGYSLADAGPNALYAISAWVQSTAADTVGLRAVGLDGVGDACLQAEVRASVVPSTWTRLALTQTMLRPNCVGVRIELHVIAQTTNLLVDDVYAIPQ
jgi:hypothetical protein